MYRLALFSSTVISRSIRSVTASTPTANALFSRSRLFKTKIPNLVICGSTSSSDALKKVDRKITKKPEVRTDLPDLPFKSEDIPDQPIIPLERKFEREKNVRGGDDGGRVYSYHYNPMEYVTDDKTYGDDGDGGGDVDGGGGDCGGGD